MAEFGRNSLWTDDTVRRGLKMHFVEETVTLISKLIKSQSELERQVFPGAAD